MTELLPYDEFGLFHENADEFGLPYDGPPTVRRTSVDLGDGRRLSALVWGTGDPELVLLHGGAQNAHTWDTVAMALGRPLVAIDLPGHGHSDWWDDRPYAPTEMADAVAVAVRALAPRAAGVVGMSMGGITSFCLAAAHPDLVRRLVVVDVTPGTNREKAKAIIDFISGPLGFPSFDDILARTIEYNPTRSVSSLRRGIMHNARQLEDGSWVWRYDRRGRNAEDGPAEGRGAEDATHEDAAPEDAAHDEVRLAHLWDLVGAIRCPILLARGGTSPVVGDEDVAELLRRQPTAEVVLVDGAGHSIQGDKPIELAALIERFVFG